MTATLTTLFIILLAIAAFGFWRGRRLRQKREESLIQKLEEDSRRTLTEATQLIEGASQKAEAVLEEAQKQGLHAEAAQKLVTKLFEDEYQKTFQALIKSSNEQFSKYIATLQDESTKLQTTINDFLKTNVDGLLSRFEGNLKLIQDRAVSSQEEAEQSMKTRVNELMVNFEQKLSSFLSTSQEKSLDAVNLEVKSAKELIDTYKQQQLSLVDASIVSVLEKTLNLVMRKKLTLRDQVDLVFESLEKAKAEKFLV